MTDWTTHRALFTSLAVLLHGVIILVTAATFFPTPGVFNAALLTVTPSSLGPSVSMGLLRSCARSDRSALPTCTRPTIPPQYDLSALSTLPVVATTALDFGTPSRGFAIVVCIGLGLSALFSLTIMLVAVRFETHNKTQKLLPNSFWMGVIIGIGFFAACLPLVTMGLLCLRFDVIIKIFNASQDEFIARFGKLWILMTVGYASLAASTAIVTAVRYRCIDPGWTTGNWEFSVPKDAPVHGGPTDRSTTNWSSGLSASTRFGHTNYGRPDHGSGRSNGSNPSSTHPAPTRRTDYVSRVSPETFRSSTSSSSTSSSSTPSSSTSSSSTSSSSTSSSSTSSSSTSSSALPALALPAPHFQL